jgi:hypothetical protein
MSPVSARKQIEAATRVDDGKGIFTRLRRGRMFTCQPILM